MSPLMISVIWTDHTTTHHHHTMVDDRCWQYIQPLTDLTDVHTSHYDIISWRKFYTKSCATALRKMLLKDAGFDFYLLLISEGTARKRDMRTQTCRVKTLDCSHHPAFLQWRLFPSQRYQYQLLAVLTVAVECGPPPLHSSLRAELRREGKTDFMVHF